MMVVTADCDLAYAKHSGRITCVPLLTADEYLLEIYFPELRKPVTERHAREFAAALNSAGGRTMSEGRIVEWCLEVEHGDQVSAAFDVAEDVRQLIENSCNGIRLANSHCDTVEKAVTNLVDSQSLHSNPKAATTLRRTITGGIQQRFTQPRGDSLFLNSIAPGYEDGYFAYLRHIEQVWEADVALRPARRIDGHRRIGALSDRFAHAVVQRFAMVFMPIGLPDTYEAVRNSFAENLGKELN